MGISPNSVLAQEAAIESLIKASKVCAAVVKKVQDAVVQIRVEVILLIDL